MVLVQVLWESIRRPEQIVTPTEDEERFIDERLAAYEAHPDLRDWVEARSELWPQLG